MQDSIQIVASRLSPQEGVVSVECDRQDLFTIKLVKPKATSWHDLSLDEKNSLLDELDSVYEKTMRDGYSVEFLHDTERGPYIALTGHGRTRPKGYDLLGVPSQGHIASACPFCRQVKAGIELPQYGAKTIQSLSGRTLLIPVRDPIAVHWFQADRKTQINLLQAASDVMRQLPGTPHIELHCGEAGYQTVWHLHLRIIQQ